MFANKYIWFLWFQGEKNMPLLVRECFASWKKMNPGWQIILLEEKNINQYIDFSSYLLNPKITIQSKSDIIRVKLLYNYGGVWVDATLFCTKPLDQWLPQYLNEGFFAFSNNHRGTLISNWFLVAEQGNYIIDCLYKDIHRFWNISYLMPQQIINFYQRVYSKLCRLFPFLNEPLKRILFPIRFLCGLYPYTSSHYLFDRLYRNDKCFKKTYNRIPKLTSDGPHHLQFFGLNKPPNNEIKKFISDNTVGVHKLNWRLAKLLTQNPNKNVVSYLLRHKNNH